MIDRRAPMAVVMMLAVWLAAPAVPAQQPVATGSAQARFGMHHEPVRFDPPEVNRTELAGGVPFYHYGEEAVPLVTVLVRIGVGSIHDEPDKVGAASMTAQVIRNGGTAAMPGDELDRELEARGAVLSISAGREETWLRLSVLKEDLAWGLGIIADLLREPLLPGEKLDEARGPRIVELRQRMDVSREAASALFPQLVYGLGNPWGWTETERTLNALTVDDLRAMHRRYYVDANMMIGMAGAVTFDEARRLAGDLLRLPEAPGGWQAPVLPEVNPVAGRVTYVVARPQTQNVIYFGHLGVDRHNEDKFPIRLFNEVLSGGFSSRLFKEVRSNRGLAYLVGGRLGEGTRRGLFYNVALTRADATAETLDVMLDVDRGLQAAPPSAEEMELARQATVNSFVFLFDTPEQIVQQKMTLDAFDYPEDYLERWVESVEAVTPEDVQRAAARHLALDRMVVLIFGEIDEALRARFADEGELIIISEEELRAKWL